MALKLSAMRQRGSLLFACMVLATLHVHLDMAFAQERSPNSAFLNTVLGTAMDAIANAIVASQQGRGYRPSCTPFRLPEGYKTLQDYCKSLSLADDSYWDEVYKNASRPSPQEGFPLRGCVAGCIVGRNAFARAARWNAGAWSGKCIRDYTVTNLLSPTIVGTSVVDVYNWTNFLPVLEQYPGKISQGPSWWDTIANFDWNIFGSNVWTIEYNDIPVVETNEDSGLLERTSSYYSNLVRASRDELKLVSTGFLLGQVMIKPRSSINQLPVPVNSGIRFALFQTCDKHGSFATGGNQRDLTQWS